MRKRNGFTLVELLAVIVVLAILMIVAFPAVLDVMNNAKKQNMALFAEKMVKDAQSRYTYDIQFGSDDIDSSSADRKATYKIDSFGYANVGEYDGCVIATRSGGENHYVVHIVDSDYYYVNKVGKGDTTEKWDSTSVVVKSDTAKLPSGCGR